MATAAFIFLTSGIAIASAVPRSPVPFIRKASRVLLEGYSESSKPNDTTNDTLGSSDPALSEQDTKGALNQLNECKWENERAVPVNRKNDPKLKAITQYLLEGSNLMYIFAALRQCVIANEILPDEDPKKVALNRPELILTRKHRELKKKNRDFYRYLKHVVTGPAVQLFVDLNREFVHAIPDKKDNTEEGAFGNIDTILKKLESINFGFVEFDDQFAKKQPVYGIYHQPHAQMYLRLVRWHCDRQPRLVH